nr:hypothetical protein [Tanacetum cinerariifolium]
MTGFLHKYMTKIIGLLYLTVWFIAILGYLALFRGIPVEDTYSVLAPSGDVTDWYQDPRLVSRSKVIENQIGIKIQGYREPGYGHFSYSVSSDSFEDSMGIALPTTQTDTTVIPIETPIIAPTIPPSPDYTPASLDYSPDPSSSHIPPLPAVSPFLSSDDDTTDSDTPYTPPSPAHGTLFIEITASTQRSPVIPHHQVMILALGQPIPHGRPYRYHPNGLVHMMTA